IEIMNAKRDRGFHHAIGIDAIALERPAGVDDEIRLDRLQLRLDVTLAIEHRRDRARGSAKRGAERFGLGTRATRDEEREPRLIGEELRQPATEGAVATEDEDAHLQQYSVNWALVARIEIVQVARPFPDFAALNPGYEQQLRPLRRACLLGELLEHCTQRAGR